jgi:hypothetical protein
MRIPAVWHIALAVWDPRMARITLVIADRRFAAGSDRH